MESLYEHFLKFVDVKVEAQSGIAILRVRAFTPGDAQEFARSLLKGSEIFVNRLNTEVFRNALLQAESEVARNRETFETVEARLTAFRNEHNMLDPEK